METYIAIKVGEYAAFERDNIIIFNESDTHLAAAEYIKLKATEHGCDYTLYTAINPRDIRPIPRTSDAWQI